jgi:broad specificity phosphatase PhoE
VLGRIGGDTDLSPRGQNYARSLAREINAMEIAGLRVWTSQLKRTQQTAAAIKAQMESLDALNELEAVSVFAYLCKRRVIIMQTIEAYE